MGFRKARTNRSTVAHTCGNKRVPRSEIGPKGGQRLVDAEDSLRGRVELVVRHALVVHAILHATGDANLHLEDLVDLLHPREVPMAQLDITSCCRMQSEGA